MRRKLFLLAFFFTAFIYATAQEKTIVFNHITSEDGLSDNEVTCMIRDRRGFMWMGTRDGLNRYDGRDFYVFKHSASDSSSLCSNNITCLACDHDSLLWIGTATSGFCCYDSRTQKFTSYNTGNTAILSNSINAMKYDPHKNGIWLALNNGGLQLFDLQSRKIIYKYPVKATRSFYDVLLKDSNMFVAQLVLTLEKAGNDSAGFRSPRNMSPASTINKIIAGSDGHIWCGAWDNALHEFNDDAELLHSYIFDGTGKMNFSADEIISLEEDADGMVWCGTKNSGLHFFNLHTKSFEGDFTTDPTITSRVYDIYRDDYQRMWIGTEHGLYIYDPLQNQFAVTELDKPDKNSSCIVYDRVITASGKEYIVSSCGLYYKKRDDRSYNFKSFQYKGDPLQLTSIFQDSEHGIFIGTNKTLFILDTTKIELQLIAVNETLRNTMFFSIYSSRISSINEIKINNTNLIAAAFYGHWIALVDIRRKNIFWLRGKPGQTRSNENLMRKMFTDSKGRLWVCGSARGISEYILPKDFDPALFPVSDTLIHSLIIQSRAWDGLQEKKSPQVNDVYDMSENNDGSFWVSTQGLGLVKFFPDSNAHPFLPIKGKYQALQGMAKTDENTLWIISSEGLLNFNISKGTFKLYDSKNGVREGISGFFFDDGSNTLSAGFDGGFISFNPKTILRDQEKPKAYVTKLWVMDTPGDSFLLHLLNFKYNQNFLKFYLSSNCFSNNDQVTYVYQLKGIDKNWRSNGSNPVITYTNLPAGNFELQFKAINSDGIESDIGVLPIGITPPFYSTIYFYLLVTIIIILLAYLFYKYRIRQILKLQEVRNKIARDLHDDIGSTIGSINLYSQVANIKLNTTTNEEVKNILDRIELSSREIIDKTGDAVWAANPANDSLKNLLLRVEGYAASVLGTAGIRFRIVCDEKISETFLEMTDRKNLFLICKEAIHNIIKYAEATEVEISISRKGNQLHMVIADNGKGFSANGKTYNANGIKNMKTRVESMNGTFRISSIEMKGTTVEVII